MDNELSKLQKVLGQQKEEARVVRAHLDSIYSRIQDTEQAIATEKLATKTIEISDHALVRYFERIFGIPVEEFRRDMSKAVGDLAAKCHTAKIKVGGIVYVVNQGVVVTVYKGDNHGEEN